MRKLVVTMLFLLAASVIIAGCTSSSPNEFVDDNKMQDIHENANLEGYAGRELTSDTSSPYLEFTKQDYDKARADGKVILLNFYANWCPTCKSEQPRAIEGFNNLNKENVIGFRVNYRDSDTDSAEVGLAQEFGIAYQHTKIVLDGNGNRVIKSPENWDSDRYVRELSGI